MSAPTNQGSQNTLSSPLALIDDYAGTQPISGMATPPPVSLGPGNNDYTLPMQSMLAGINFNDLWDRIRAGFRMDLTVDNKRVISERNWYVKHGDYLLKVFERSRPYLYHVVNELESKGLPLELALLPVVESAYDPFAYSRSSAAGLWQFIPSTGASFGLKQSWWFDGRRDIVLSTAAATDYLMRLNQMFDGDWELALAAYNAGGGTLRRAIAKNARRGKGTDYWSLNLSNETERYVPKLIALAQIIQNPTHFNVNPLPIANRPYFTVVETGGQIDLAKASEMSGVSLEEIYRLNPGFNRWASDPAGPHRLAVPVTQAERLKIGIANLPTYQRVSWQRYKVKRGDSLTKIAQNFQTTPSHIMQVNHLRTDHLQAGKQLLIPTAHNASTDLARGLENRRLLSANQVSANQAASYMSPAAKLDTMDTAQRLLGELLSNEHTATNQASLHSSAHPNRKRLNYRVASGDTLWSIAKKFNASVAEIARSNGISPKDTLKLGQTLTIWLDDDTAQDTRLALSADLDTVDTGGPPQNTTRKVHYSVRSGDSLYRIADRFNLDVKEISRWNKLDDGAILKPGQQLVLFVDVTDTATP
jgi:membrane-bound lytic murein transglycosylase D